MRGRIVAGKRTRRHRLWLRLKAEWSWKGAGSGAGVTTGDKESALCWLTELSTNCASKWRKFKKYIYI